MLASDLDRAGMTVWLDERELRAGDDLAVIESAIRGSDCLVVVLSAAALQSPWVEHEISMAGSLGIRVLPALLEDVPGSQYARFGGLAHADFRRRQDYRRSTHRLIAAIEGAASEGRFLRAKEAAALVRAERSPLGDLFGLSQQGVATLYSLAKFSDWEFSDAADGTSRLWITEFYDPASGRIQPYAVMDGEVRVLDDLYVLGTDPSPLPGSATVFSCSLNHLHSTVSAEDARALAEEHEFVQVSRRYCRFLPVLLAREFVDSTVAVSAATESAFGGLGLPAGPGEDLIVLTRLECDKRYRELPTWIVSFFDPALADSIVTVGVDATTGRVRHPRMRSEILNANFFPVVSSTDGAGGMTFDMGAQLRAIENHIWDIPEAGPAASAELTAREAVGMAEEWLGSWAESQQWQLAFLSNTGVVRTVLSSATQDPEIGLMKPGGGGQWVMESLPQDPGRVGQLARLAGVPP